MTLEPFEQFKQFFEKSKEILILLPENPSGDAIGGAWAIYFFLQKKNIIPTIAFPNHISQKYSFLPRPQNILNEISGARNFILSFDTSRNKIIKFETEEKESKFNIYLTPEKGSIDPRDFSFILAKFKYDLIIVIDTPDLEKLGKLYENNSDLFFEVPVVNIDHRSNNENFGQINLVDVLASSSSEIIKNLLESIDENSIDKLVAECLLTGIISATESFQKKNTTPKSLLAAADLMEKGADQQEIVRWLYKTHPLHILKLWGRVMAKIKWDENLRLAWSELSLEDFVQSRSKAEDLNVILEKLQENYSEGKLFMVFYQENQALYSVKMKSYDPEILRKLFLSFGGTIKRDVLETSITPENSESIENLTIQRIKKALS